MQAILTERTQLTPDIIEFIFTSDQDINFIAGQFTELTVPHQHVDNRGQTRQFTIASKPDAQKFTIMTRIPPRPSTFKQAMNSLKLGAAVQFTAPMGDFVLPKLEQIPVVFVAYGIGITPAISILSSLDKSTNTRHIELVHYVRSIDDFLNRPQFESFLGINYRGILCPDSSMENMPLPITPYQTDDMLYYLSGPKRFVQAMSEELSTLGFDGSSIIRDEFTAIDS